MSGNTREQLRAVLLAFVMVTSVVGATVAFSGSAAADDASIDIDNSPNNIALSDGETQTVQVSTDEADEDSPYTIKINVTDLVQVPGIQSSDVSASLNNNDGDTTVDSNPNYISSNNTIVTKVTDGSTGDSGDVQFTVDITVDAGDATAARGVAYEITEDADRDGIDGRVTTGSFKIGTSTPSTVHVSEYGGNAGDIQTAIDDSADDATIQIQPRSGAPYQTSPAKSTYEVSKLTTGNSETLTNASGTPTIDGTGDTALVVTGTTGDVTVDGLSLTANDDQTVIEIRGNLIRNGGQTGSSLTVQNSDITIKDSGGSSTDTLGIKAVDSSDNPVAIGDLIVSNVVFDNDDSSNEGERGIKIRENSGTVSVTDSTFKGHLAYAAQFSGTDGVTFDNNDVQGSNFNFEGIVFSTGAGGPAITSSPASQGDITGATITNNDFSGISSSSAAIAFIDANGADSTVDFQSSTYSVNNNNFTSMDGNYAIATDNDFTLENGDVDLGITIDATDNFYGTSLGPQVRTGGGSQGDVRQVAAVGDDYADSNGAKINDDGDITFRPFRIGPATSGSSVDFDIVNDLSQQNTDSLTRVNVTIPANNGESVNENSINVSVFNNEVGELTRIVDEGSLQNSALSNGSGSVNVVSSSLGNGNSSVESLRFNISLKEDPSTAELLVNATDTGGNDIFADENADSSALDGTESLQTAETGTEAIDMNGEKFRVIPDDSNPFAKTSSGTAAASENATVAVVVADRFGNNVTDDTDNANELDDIGDITLSSGQSSAV
jgi:surface glycoprotein (TIGR04207 family)